MHNKTINLTVLRCASAGKLWRRYERGSKINKTSHVLDLRHVVAGLSALK